MKNTYARKCLFLNILIFTSFQAHSSTYNFKSSPDKGSVEFKAIGKPAFLKIEGKGNGPKGSLKIEDKSMSGEMSFDLNSLDTGIELRDEHMKDKYLKVKEFPLSVLKFEKVEITDTFDPVKNILKGNPLKAKLTLNNITKDVLVEWESKNSGKILTLKSQLSIKLTDFNIEVPEYSGITVADEVKIEVKTELAPTAG